MYTPDHFTITDPNEIRSIMAAYPLAMLIAPLSGVIEATPVPVVVDAPPPDPSGSLGALRYHLATANPLAHLEEGQEVLLTFMGPQAYVSPDWYATERLPPTWNYVTAQARGRVSDLTPGELRTLLDDLSAANESQLPKPPWTADKMGEELIARMLESIRGMRVSIDALEGKAKLSQNRSARDRAGAAAALAGLESLGSAHAVAAEMRKRSR